MHFRKCAGPKRRDMAAYPANLWKTPYLAASSSRTQMGRKRPAPRHSDIRRKVDSSRKKAPRVACLPRNNVGTVKLEAVSARHDNFASISMALVLPLSSGPTKNTDREPLGARETVRSSAPRRIAFQCDLGGIFLGNAHSGRSVLQFNSGREGTSRIVLTRSLFA